MKLISKLLVRKPICKAREVKVLQSGKPYSWKEGGDCSNCADDKNVRYYTFNGAPESTSEESLQYATITLGILIEQVDIAF